MNVGWYLCTSLPTEQDLFQPSWWTSALKGLLVSSTNAAPIATKNGIELSERLGSKGTVGDTLRILQTCAVLAATIVASAPVVGGVATPNVILDTMLAIDVEPP